MKNILQIIFKKLQKKSRAREVIIVYITFIIIRGDQYIILNLF